MPILSSEEAARRAIASVAEYLKTHHPPGLRFTLAHDLSEALLEAAGEDVSGGICPYCGALTHPIDPTLVE